MNNGDNVERVRNLWAAWRHGGVDELIQLVDPEVAWRPFGAQGRELQGAEELRTYVQEARERGEEMEAEVYSYEELGDGSILATGHLRHRSGQSFTDTQLHWLYTFRGPKLLRADAFTSREEALAAANDGH